MVLWYGFDYRKPIYYNSMVGSYWLLVGTTIYYPVGITLAFVLKDNQAFCKYVCPVTIPLKISSRFSLMKVKGDSTQCTECGACEKICPMDILIINYIMHEKRVLSTECSLFQTCISICAKDTLKLSFGFDVGGKELLHERTQLTKNIGARLKDGVLN